MSDALGSTLGLADASGTVQTVYGYEPFRNTSVSGSSTTPYQYTGRENDGLGLQFSHARYYSPTLQRFASEDPLGFGGEINSYAYVSDSPANLTGPFDLDKQSSWERTKEVNQCAGHLSQTFSLNIAPGNCFSDALLGNTFGTMSQAAFGLGRANAIGQLIIDNPVPRASLNGCYRLELPQSQQEG